jgi:ferredoxin
VKHFRIEPVGRDLDVNTATPLVQSLLKNGNGRVKQVCGGKGLCATCHVHVTQGAGSLSPLNDRERRTLSLITGADARSRLACQALVLGPGVVVEIPQGIYLESLADLEALVGRRADEPLCHPQTGAVLVPTGKIITRSVVKALGGVLDVAGVLRGSERVI